MGLGGYVAGGANNDLQSWATAILTGVIAFIVLTAIAGIVLVRAAAH